MNITIVEMDTLRGTNNGKMRLVRNTFEGWKPKRAPGKHTPINGTDMINKLGC